jgi:hypothetical protein
METRKCTEKQEDWCRLLNRSGVDDNVEFTEELYDRAPTGGTYVQIGDDWIERSDERIADLPFAQLTCLPAYLLDQKELSPEHIRQLNFDPVTYERFANLRRKFLNMDGRYDTASDKEFDMKVMCKAIVTKNNAYFATTNNDIIGKQEVYTCQTVPTGGYIVSRIRKGEGIYMRTMGKLKKKSHDETIRKMEERHATMFGEDVPFTCLDPYRSGQPLAETNRGNIPVIWFLLLLLGDYNASLSFQYTMLYEEDAVLTQAVKYLNQTYLK